MSDQQHEGTSDQQRAATRNHGEILQTQYFHVPMPQPLYGYPYDPSWGPPPYIPPQQQVFAEYQRYQYPVMDGVPLPPGIPGLGGSTDPLEAVLGPFPCVRLRNLPFDTALEDILSFLQGLVLIDVIHVGQGDAFVVLANPMDFQMALQRSRQTIGRRFIDIGPASRIEYYEAIAAQHERERGPKLSSSGSVVSGGSSGRAVRSDGDDPQHADAPVHSIWRGGGEPMPHSMQSMSGGGGHGGGPTSGTYDVGLAQHHSGAGSGMLPMAGGQGGSMSRLGQGRPASAGGSALHAPLQKRTGGGIQVGEHTGFLRMRGLPFSAAKDDIVNFFVGYNPVPESIVLTYRNDGRATGEAYVGFASPDDSKRAMELHRRSMGSRYIELFISNKDEHGRALARFGSR